MPSLEKHDYGPLGELTRAEWTVFLNSDKGLFKKIAEEPPAYVSGPVLDERGKVSKDLFFLETSYFTLTATKEQTDYFIELSQVHLSASREYALTITKLKWRWQRDMRWLQTALHYLEEEESLLHDDEELLKKNGKTLAIHFPDALKRHYPQLFQEVDFKGLTPEDALRKIKNILQEEIEPEEKYLENYLKKTKQEMPFLFEES